MTWGRTETDTCRELVLPALAAAGWLPDQVRQQYQLQNPDADHVKVQPGGGARIADYVLEVDGVPVAVVEAKRESSAPADGIQQGIDYARRLDVPLVLSTNGHRIVLHDRVTGTEGEISQFPGPATAWAAYQSWVSKVDGAPLSDSTAQALRVPFDRHLRAHGGTMVKVPRNYQRRAVHSVIRAIGRGEQRVLLLMATGTGKTFTALQLVHKLRTQAMRARDGRPYRVLYLADRDILVKTPQTDFAQSFGDAVTRLTSSNITQSRDVYFATYQALDRTLSDDVMPDDEGTPASLFHSLPQDFFDLVVVDECHRGSAAPESSWRAILDHFSSAVQVGLTATPKRDVNVDTYDYFGEPVFTYSLREGIEDGYLAPYRVRRAMFDVDAYGWSPSPGQVDRFGVEVPEGHYGTPDFERRLVLISRTSAMARHLVTLLSHDPGARALVFCVDREHAQSMRQALLAADPDRTRRDPSWAVRIVGGEPEKDRLLEEFTDPDRLSPAVATTSRLLSTGVDIEDLRYVVLCRPVGSMIEFKQIVGRGTRLYPPKDKQDFWVVDYVGASSKFSDEAFDGPPAAPPVREVVLPDGTALPAGPDVGADDTADLPGAHDAERELVAVAEPEAPFDVTEGGELGAAPHRVYVDDVEVTLSGESVYLRDPRSGALTLVEYSQYVGDQVRTLYPTLDDLRSGWSQADRRADVITELRRRNIKFSDLLSTTGLPDADPFDVLAHVAWDLPPLSRRQRADAARSAHVERIAALSDAARMVIETLLDRYASYGIEEISVRALEMSPLREHGSRSELVQAFGDGVAFRGWLDDLQAWLYENSSNT